MSDIKNVLLLSLSTFSYDRANSRYFIKESKFKYTSANGNIIDVEGKYQLDPVPNLLKSQGIKFDYVIMLATSEVQDKVDVYDADEDKWIENISAADYFIDFLKDKMAANANKSNAINVIDIDVNDPSDAIKNSAKIINNIVKQSKLHIYIDTHGGFRSTQMVVEAILGLLIDDKIEKTVYSMYDDSNNRRIDIDGAEKIFDFVSGINEFRNYGRIDSLLNYLDFDKNKGILGPICKISEGIQWCDIVKFEEGLKNLKNYYSSVHKTIQDKYLALFVDQIKEDYGALLVGTQIDALDMIKWCLKKGFYQQALTIIESRMADSLINRGIMLITPVGNKFSQKYSSHSNSQEPLKTNILFNGCVYMFIPQRWWLDSKEFNKTFTKNQSNDGIKVKFENALNARKNNKLGYDMSALLDSAKNTSIDKAYPKKTKNYQTNVTKNNVVNFNNKCDKKSLVIFLFLHKIMKDIRNEANHASAHSSYDHTATKRAIEFYIDLVEELTP